MRFQFFCVLALVILSGPAAAQSGGMKYTTMGSGASALKPKDLNMKSLNFEEKEKERLELEAGSQKQKDAMAAVWNRYKALAEGRENDKRTDLPEPAEPPKPKKISLEEAKGADQVSSPAPGGARTGGSLLDHYEEIKARRSQMKTITMKKPAPPTPPEAPEVPKEKKEEE